MTATAEPRPVGFDPGLYLREQTVAIRDRARRFDNKLYLEFGGKLLFDMHAARVLPGFDPNVKMRLLQGLKDKADVLLCIYAGDIERKKMRADFGITYDSDALKLIDDLHEWGINVLAVIISRYDDQPAALTLRLALNRPQDSFDADRFVRAFQDKLKLKPALSIEAPEAFEENAAPLVDKRNFE